MVVVLIISFVLAVIVVNAGQRLLMRVMGASGMFFSMKKKLIVIFLVALVIGEIILNVFGIGTRG